MRRPRPTHRSFRGNMPAPISSPPAQATPAPRYGFAPGTRGARPVGRWQPISRDGHLLEPRGRSSPRRLPQRAAALGRCTLRVDGRLSQSPWTPPRCGEGHGGAHPLQQVHRRARRRDRPRSRARRGALPAGAHRRSPAPGDARRGHLDARRHGRGRGHVERARGWARARVDHRHPHRLPAPRAAGDPRRRGQRRSHPGGASASSTHALLSPGALRPIRSRPGKGVYNVVIPRAAGGWA